MRIVVAPQAFKESLSAREAAEAIARGVRRALPSAEVVLLPVADGGDDTLETLVDTTGGEYREAQVTGPVGEQVRARWGVLGDGVTAVVEAAEACGMVRMPPHHPRDPSRTTTRGVGELVRHALDQGHRRIIVGVGGSATNDGGAGMAQALGIRLLVRLGRDVGPGGAALLELERLDASGRDPRIAETTVTVAVDVSNPLCGPEGAAATYGPQKGATPEVVVLLDGAMARMADVVQRDLGLDVRDLPGAGAAGGMGAGLVAFLGAELRPGADLVCEAVDLEHYVKGADLVIVGEGRLDWQTAFNKAPFAVARRAGQHGVPVLALVGSLGPGHEQLAEHGLDRVRAISPLDMPREEALASAALLLEEAAAEELRAWAP